MTVVDVNEISSFVDELKEKLGPLGFEFQPFKVCWYNACVNPVFHLKYDSDTVAVLIMSNPSMFENAFIPYLKSNFTALDNSLHDPIDDCMVFYISKIKEIFHNLNIEIIYDFELHPNRRPKVLMQTAAHVSGAAYFYQSSCVTEDTFGSRKMFGVCIHPKYGGWFALRAILILQDVQCPNLPRISPQDVVPSQKLRRQLLEMYNFHWEDGTFRDIIPVDQKYSPLAIKYFSELPKNRFSLVKEITNGTRC